MSRRKRYQDTRSAGRSQVVPKGVGDWRSRHRRRLEAAVTTQELLFSWCAAQGINVQVSNQNHHWTFWRTDKARKVVEWWPASAKLVVGREYRRGIHVHDFAQCREQLVRALDGGRL